VTTPTPSDLQTFLGLSAIDSTRAAQILGIATQLCQTIVTPLPDAAFGIVLTVAGRAFANPEGITAETVGPYSVQRPNPGLYLTRFDKATLRRMAGGTSAFSVDTLPTGSSAVQLVTITGIPTGGTFTLSASGAMTSAIPYNASAATVQDALTAVGAFGVGNVTVSGSGPYTVTWGSNLATTPIDTLTAVNNLTGGTSPAVVITVITKGVYAPGQILAWWDRSPTNGPGAQIPGFQ
jgi:hypothetical protein